MWQNVLVDVVVVLAFMYAAWSMGPQAMRQRLSARALTLPLLPTALRKRLSTVAAKSGGCHCDSCPSQKPLAPQVHKVVFHKAKK